MRTLLLTPAMVLVAATASSAEIPPDVQAWLDGQAANGTPFRCRVLRYEYTAVGPEGVRSEGIFQMQSPSKAMVDLTVAHEPADGLINPRSTYFWNGDRFTTVNHVQKATTVGPPSWLWIDLRVEQLFPFTPGYIPKSIDTDWTITCTRTDAQRAFLVAEPKQDSSARFRQIDLLVRRSPAPVLAAVQMHAASGDRSVVVFGEVEFSPTEWWTVDLAGYQQFGDE